MKIRGLLIAALVFFILAGVLYWSNHRKPAEETAKASADAAPVILKLDQNAIANARLNNLEKDLNLKGSEYNTCISILYVG